MKAMGIDASKPAASAPAVIANGTAHQNGHAHGDLPDPGLPPACQSANLVDSKSCATVCQKSCHINAAGHILKLCAAMFGSQSL